eukprot:97048_1
MATHTIATKLKRVIPQSFVDVCNQDIQKLYPIILNKICLSYYYFNFSYTQNQPKFTISNTGLFINCTERENIRCDGVLSFEEYLKLSNKIVSKAIFKMNDQTIETYVGIGAVDTSHYIFSFANYSNHSINYNISSTDSLWFNAGDNISLQMQSTANDDEIECNILNERNHQSQTVNINNLYNRILLQTNKHDIMVCQQAFVSNSSQMV